MRLTLLACVAIALIAFASGQEVSRRERLRKLISAARAGDIEARKTLRDLRDKLRNRGGKGAAVQSPEPTQPPKVIEPQPVFEPRTPVRAEPQPVQHRFQPQEPVQSRRQRVRPQLQNEGVRTRVGDFHEPHRALNRGLEVDSRSEANAIIRVTNMTNQPPVQTIRRYSYFDEEGNYIFGYEAADGSFKEEKRGKDCIVHGKYGYVDPDGIKREFTYVSGNRCDPNAPAEPELQHAQPPPPKNKQFLLQTQEKQLDQNALKEFKPIQRPRPIQQAEPVFQRPRQPQQPQQPIRQPQRGRRIQSRRRQQQTEQVVREQPIQVEPEISLDKAPQQPHEETQPQEKEPLPPSKQSPSFPPFQHTEVRPKPQVFQPRPRPVDIGFNFDQEFKQIFDNFDRPRPQARPRPTPAPRRPPPPPPPRPSPKPSPAPPKKPISPKFDKPAPKPKAPVTLRPRVDQTPNVAHQLVFDSATGAFKTVPLSGSSLSSAPPSFRAPPPRPPPPPPAPKTGRPLPSSGKPLSSPGFSPLPSVPLGSLSFGGSDLGEFNNFFRQLVITPV